MGFMEQRIYSREPDAERDGTTTSVRRVSGYLVAKRAIDIVGATVGLLLLAPVFLVITVLIAIGSPGPILHRRRVLARQAYTDGGLQTFDAFKFRTMIVNADAYLAARPELLREYERDFKLKTDPRITSVGHHLRRLSLDELPQLFNILSGQMTLVGPRMITPPELGMYGNHAACLLSVKPGLTGLWQVSGRQDVSYEERVRLDMYYIENRTLRMDIEILLRTVLSVLKREGAY
jgi:lipopolysaccharide/colanic/teichoic acid biosynthesis glycosyltransferase